MAWSRHSHSRKLLIALLWMFIFRSQARNNVWTNLISTLQNSGIMSSTFRVPYRILTFSFSCSCVQLRLLRACWAFLVPWPTSLKEVLTLLIAVSTVSKSLCREMILLSSFFKHAGASGAEVQVGKVQWHWIITYEPWWRAGTCIAHPTAPIALAMEHCTI